MLHRPVKCESNPGLLCDRWRSLLTLFWHHKSDRHPSVQMIRIMCNKVLRTFTHFNSCTLLINSMKHDRLCLFVCGLEMLLQPDEFANLWRMDGPTENCQNKPVNPNITACLGEAEVSMTSQHQHHSFNLNVIRDAEPQNVWVSGPRVLNQGSDLYFCLVWTWVQSQLHVMWYSTSTAAQRVWTIST